MTPRGDRHLSPRDEKIRSQISTAEQKQLWSDRRRGVFGVPAFEKGNPTMRLFFVAVAAACSIVPGAASGQIATKNTELVGAGGRAIGTVILTQAPKGIILRVQASGLTEGWHGMHIHSVATCADPGFKASGGHVHAMSGASVHGFLNTNATDFGDLPNLYVAKDGSAAAEVFVANVSLGEAAGRLNLLDADGSALVIHAAPDDHSSQPIGGAGARIACAAIK